MLANGLPPRNLHHTPHCLGPSRTPVPTKNHRIPSKESPMTHAIVKTADGVAFTILEGYCGEWLNIPVENAHIKCQRMLWQIETD